MHEVARPRQKGRPYSQTPGWTHRCFSPPLLALAPASQPVYLGDEPPASPSPSFPKLEPRLFLCLPPSPPSTLALSHTCHQPRYTLLHYGGWNRGDGSWWRRRRAGGTGEGCLRQPSSLHRQGTVGARAEVRGCPSGGVWISVTHARGAPAGGPSWLSCPWTPSGVRRSSEVGPP